MVHVRLKRLLFVTPDRLAAFLPAIVALLWLFDRFRGFGLFYQRGWAVLIAVAVLAMAVVGVLLWCVGCLVFRRAIRFSIRSLLLVAPMLAIASSWFVSARSEASRQRDALEWLMAHSAGGYQYEPTGWDDSHGNYHRRWLGPDWLTSRIGYDFFLAVEEVQLRTNQRDIAAGALDQLAGFPHTKRLTIEGPGFHDQSLRHFRPPPELEQLDLRFTNVSDAGLRCFADATSVTSLSISGAPIDGSGLKNLRSLAHLQTLDLSDESITDAGLAQADFPQLRLLNLASTLVAGRDVPFARNLPRLVTLNLSGTKFCDAGCEQLAGLDELAGLDLYLTPITDSALESLAKLPHLRSLGLRSTKIGNRGLAQLGGLAELRSLDLQGTLINDAGLANLRSLRELRDLDLSFTQISDDGLKAIADMPKLESLKLVKTPIADAGLAELRGLKNLRSLDLGATRASAGAMKQLYAALPNCEINYWHDDR